MRHVYTGLLTVCKEEESEAFCLKHQTIRNEEIISQRRDSGSLLG